MPSITLPVRYSTCDPTHSQADRLRAPEREHEQRLERQHRGGERRVGSPASRAGALRAAAGSARGPSRAAGR